MARTLRRTLQPILYRLGQWELCFNCRRRRSNARFGAFLFREPDFDCRLGRYNSVKCYGHAGFRLKVLKRIGYDPATVCFLALLEATYDGEEELVLLDKGTHSFIGSQGNLVRHCPVYAFIHTSGRENAPSVYVEDRYIEAALSSG